jgi:serine/threonine protein phosphatase PrpC
VTPSLRFAARSDVGLLRELNEDSMYAGPHLLAIADGMGGHAAGEVASRIAIESVAPLDDSAPGSDLVGDLRDAVESASGYLHEMVAADTALDGMGTTLTALLFAGRRLGLVHVGDSRCYLLRDGELSQITHDHTLVQRLVDEGRITPEEATTHPQRSWITRSLTGHGELELDLSIREARVGDRYLLCSDGLSGPVSEETIAETLRAAADPEAACDQLIDLALRAGGPDNVTAIVADVVDEDIEEDPIVGGAAADRPSAPTTDEDTPAVRAAHIGRRRRHGAEPAPQAEDSAGASRRRGRLPLVIGVVVLIVIAAAIATWLYARSQYYVGATGNPPVVAVYQGIGSLASVDARTDIPLSALPEDAQNNVRNHIDVGSKTAAGDVVRRLRTQACPAPPPAPTTTPTPQSTSKTTSKASTPAPTPTPTPTPSYCNG